MNKTPLAVLRKTFFFVAIRLNPFRSSMKDTNVHKTNSIYIRRVCVHDFISVGRATVTRRRTAIQRQVLHRLSFIIAVIYFSLHISAIFDHQYQIEFVFVCVSVHAIRL